MRITVKIFYLCMYVCECICMRVPMYMCECMWIVRACVKFWAYTNVCVCVCVCVCVSMWVCSSRVWVGVSESGCQWVWVWVSYLCSPPFTKWSEQAQLVKKGQHGHARQHAGENITVYIKNNWIGCALWPSSKQQNKLDITQHISMLIERIAQKFSQCWLKRCQRAWFNNPTR